MHAVTAKSSRALVALCCLACLLCKSSVRAQTRGPALRRPTMTRFVDIPKELFETTETSEIENEKSFDSTQNFDSVEGEDGEKLPPPEGTPTARAPASQTSPIQHQDTPHSNASQSINQFWWKPLVADSILGRPLVPISSNSLAIETLANSPQVQVLAARPQAAKTMIVEELAQFDWSAFVESRWRDTTEPTGSTLITGANNVFRNHQFTNQAGVRKNTRHGGQLSVGQLFGLENSNSQFFSPQDQGESTFTIDYSQPLLRGAGRFVNESNVVLARLANSASEFEFVGQVQAFLMEVNERYWQLYMLRASLLIERRLYHRAQQTIDLLKKREKVDASKEMIARAESSLATRKTRLVEARRQLLDQQTLLRNLVNSVNLDEPSRREFLPTDVPSIHNLDISSEQAFATAMQHRPEVARAIRDIRSASVRYRVSENDLLPQLDLVFQTYARGLRGNFDLGSAFGDMYVANEPTYSAGLLFEVPIARRAAKAVNSRRQIELAELTSQFKVLLEQILLDTVTGLRALETTKRTLETNRDSLARASETLRLLQVRYELMSREEDGSASLRIQDILNNHQTVAVAELAYVQSEADHAIALIRLRRALGTLIRPNSF